MFMQINNASGGVRFLITALSVGISNTFCTWYLLIYVSRYLDQEIAKESIQSSSQAATSCQTTQREKESH